MLLGVENKKAKVAWDFLMNLIACEGMHVQQDDGLDRLRITSRRARFQSLAIHFKVYACFFYFFAAASFYPSLQSMYVHTDEYKSLLLCKT